MEKAAAYAVTARNLIVFNRSGILSTNSRSQLGYPFGSVTPYDVDSDGRVVIFVALIAEHYKNLKADGRASLCVSDAFGFYNPQESARATILGKFEEISEKERADVESSYRARFPGAVDSELAKTFRFMGMVPEKIRWIGGFGEIAWVGGDDYRAATVDALAYTGMEIAQHLNEAHRSTLDTLVAAHATHGVMPKSTEMVGVDSVGFTIRYVAERQAEVLRVTFPAPVLDALGAQESIMSLAQAAPR